MLKKIEKFRSHSKFISRQRTILYKMGDGEGAMQHQISPEEAGGDGTRGVYFILCARGHVTDAVLYVQH